MDYTQLGRSGLSVSRLCLGTMNFGPETSEDDSHAIMDRAHEHGINYFDTANVYGWRKGEGVTEQILGRWFAKGGGRRERTVLATKVYGDMGDWPNERRLSALHIRRSCEESLRRLQTDHIDVYQMHHVDLNTPWDEIWEAMEVLRQQGKIIYAGSSNHAGWHIARAQETAGRRRFYGLVSEQSLYNLLERSADHPAVPLESARARHQPRRRGAATAGRDLPRPRRSGAAGVRLVTATPDRSAAVTRASSSARRWPARSWISWSRS